MTPSQPPVPPDDAPPHATASGPIHALADATVVPVETALRGRSLWLRGAIACHLASSAAATWVAWRQGLPDWPAYGWLGLLTAVLVANFVRWRRRAGWVRRTAGTAASTVVTLVWAALLADRACAGRLPEADAAGPAPAWFGVAVGLLLLCAAALVGHLLTSNTVRRAAPGS